MKSDFISGFIKRGGVSIILSTALVKFGAAILSILVVNILSKDDYGFLSYVLSIYSIALVMAGFGGNYSLLRFGSITSSFILRNEYYQYTLKEGLKRTIIIVTIVCIYSFFIPDNMKNTQPMIILMSFGLFSFYALETLRSYFRIINLNKLYSKVNVYNAVILIVTTIVLTFLLKVYGYIIALILVPLFVFFIFKKNNNIASNKLNINPKEYWGYGLHTSVSAIANQIVFIAPLLLALFNEPESGIANFKVATIIPFNLLTLPGILMIADFSYLARSFNDKNVLISYYKNYLKTILPLSFIVFLILTIFSEFIVETLFGEQYLSCVYMYKLFMIATFITYIFRNPLGNILLAVGKAKWNGYSTYFFCFFYILSSCILYPHLGMLGVAYGLCLTFILSGFVSLFMFIYYIKKLENK